MDGPEHPGAHHHHRGRFRRVEPASVEILRALHDLFAEAVRRWLTRTRYSPAQASGVEVRQLVEQRVEFDLRPYP